MEWIEQTLKSPGFSFAALPAAVVMGFLTAVTSSCNLGIIAAVVGFAGSRGESFRRRDALSTSLFFAIGSVVALSLLGLLVSQLGGLAGTSLGRIGKAIMGFAVIFFGLAALNLVPFRLPSLDMSKIRISPGPAGAAVFGLAVGAASIACTLTCCGPLLPAVLGLAAARGQAAWGTSILTLFAIGYSIPLAGLMLGIGFGRTTGLALKVLRPVRLIAGLGLIAIGFWILATL